MWRSHFDCTFSTVISMPFFPKDIWFYRISIAFYSCVSSLWFYTLLRYYKLFLIIHAQVNTLYICVCILYMIHEYTYVYDRWGHDHSHQSALFLIHCIISASFSKLICLLCFYFSVIGIRLCTVTAECLQTHSLTFFNTVLKFRRHLS